MHAPAAGHITRMSASIGSVLAVIADAERRQALLGFDPGPGLVLHICASAREAERMAERVTADVLLADRPPGLAWLRQMRGRDAQVFTIAWLLPEDWRFAVDAINDGALDAVLLDPVPLPSWMAVLQRGCEQTLMRRHTASLLTEFAARNAELLAFKERLEAMVAERTRHLLEAQERLQAAQRMVVQMETQATVSFLLRGVAHEFNNPLAAIYGYAQRLRRLHAADPETARRLDIILEEVGHCRTVVEQLRQLAMPLTEPVTRVELAPVLEEALRRLEAIGRRPPRLAVRGPLPPVLAAPRALGTVCEHILANAIEAGAAQVEASLVAHGERVRWMLANDGETPSDEVVANAVRPLFTTKAADGHRGLGLTTAAALLREQDGTIEFARRADGPGAAVIIELPAADPPPRRDRSPAAAAAVAAREAAPLRVLVVEDEPAVAELLGDVLRDFGLQPSVAATAAAAMGDLARQHYDALVVDLTLPDGNGLDLVRRALVLHPELAGRVVLTTGDVQPTQRQALAVEHGLPVLAKPFTILEVQRLLADLGIVQ